MAEAGYSQPDAIVFASYGTTREDQRAGSLDSVAVALQAAFPGVRVVQGYTSAKVLRALAARGEEAGSVADALAVLARDGARRVLVQPGHVVAGEAFAQVERAVADARSTGAFECVALGRPLLSSAADVQHVAAVMAARHVPREGEAVLLVGHGADDTAGLPYAALGYSLLELGRGDIVVGAMHGYPGFDAASRLLAQRVGRNAAFARERQVALVPLMLTAGSHAHNDLAGDDARSWKSRLEAKGYRVDLRLEGLGAIEGVRRLYADHATQAWRSASS